MYHYIFFDLDGTLTDSKEGILNSLRYAFDKLGEPVPPEIRGVICKHSSSRSSMPPTP